MPPPGPALRARLLCVLAASVAACSPPKDPGTPAAPETTAAPVPPKSGPPPSLAEGEPPRPTATPAPTPTPTEVLTSGPAPAPPPDKCDQPNNRCFPPRSDMRGAMVKVDLSKLPFDANGCLPQDQVGGTCLGFRPTSGPKVKGGQCCYDGCSSQPAPCGRPLLRGARAVLAPLVRLREHAVWS